jgi:tetratricopeptide (TPR) repeat protein
LLTELATIPLGAARKDKESQTHRLSLFDHRREAATGEKNMPDHFVISYSAVDGLDFALKLADDLATGPPAFPVWLDKRNIRPGQDWDEQIVEAIRACKAMMFVMTPDSVRANSVCKDEWVRALKYKKPVIPLLRHPDVELPFRLGSREYVDFSGAFDSALARLRRHLAWMDSREGGVQALKDRLADAERELRRAQPEWQARIQDEIDELSREIAQQQLIIDNPQAAERRVQQSIAVSLEGERQPAKPVSGISHGKFINPPPVIAPTWFQDRHVETRMLGDFLKDESLRLMTVVGRGGIGKSAMVCRLLRSLESGRLPDDGGALAVDGIVYLSDARAFHRVTVPDLYAALTKLLSEETIKRLDAVYKNPRGTTEQTIQALAEAFARGRTVILLDNFEDVLSVDTGQIQDAELDEALRALLRAPPHGLKVIITTRVAPSDLALVEPALQRRLDLDAGLGFSDAKAMLQVMDVDGKVGLQHADDTLLREAWERTRGYPRALEHLFAVLSADRDTTLKDLLEDTRQFLPEQVVEVLVGEAFSRLDATAQLVMQALAIYRYPVIPAAVDYLLQPYVTGMASGRVLSRLVNMQFVRRDAGRYYIHQVDRDYALSRIPQGESGDGNAEVPHLTQFALRHRAAEWFKLSRKPRETWESLEDLTAQLSEFDLRCEAEDYDTAAALLLEFDTDYLALWGYYRLLIERHERLQGKIIDPALAGESIGTLGEGYRLIGIFDRAVVCHRQALDLARMNNDREGEAVALNNLAISMAGLGHNARAIEYFEEIINSLRERGHRQGEAVFLNNLGECYFHIGQLTQAVAHRKRGLAIAKESNDRITEVNSLASLGELYGKLGQKSEALNSLKDALGIARQIGYRTGEAGTLVFLGDFYLLFSDCERAVKVLREAIEIADEIGDVQFQKLSRTSATIVYIHSGDMDTARVMAEAAGHHPHPIYDAQTSIALGIVAYRQGDLKVAREAFTAAIAQAEHLLAMTPNRYEALDAKALALCGLALCGDTAHITAAREAFTAARKVISAPGVVKMVLLLFDALTQADAGHILADVRPAATESKT